ncbi:hypothetical protein [Flavobacterium caeni]|uniref:hypothetical protein n=1 Tax=Flavobacterium caeni TaxID=490189 RepID=UPI001B8B7A07|nr:hypothetical protein [Flavobacterium caeni]
MHKKVRFGRQCTTTTQKKFKIQLLGSQTTTPAWTGIVKAYTTKSNRTVKNSCRLRDRLLQKLSSNAIMCEILCAELLLPAFSRASFLFHTIYSLFLRIHQQRVLTSLDFFLSIIREQTLTRKPQRRRSRDLKNI